MIISASDIVDVLVANRWRRNFVLPHYTPRSWFECDVYEVTEAGYFREYEVKTSRGDFFRDAAKKMPDSWRWDGSVKVDLPGRVKHQSLAARDVRGPARFWFVTPPGLVTVDELPDFAGLIEVGPSDRGRMPTEREIRKAPQLHKEPATVDHARGICYWRLHALRNSDRVTGVDRRADWVAIELPDATTE